MLRTQAHSGTPTSLSSPSPTAEGQDCASKTSRPYKQPEDWQLSSTPIPALLGSCTEAAEICRQRACACSAHGHAGALSAFVNLYSPRRRYEEQRYPQVDRHRTIRTASLQPQPACQEATSSRDRVGSSASPPLHDQAKVLSGSSREKQSNIDETRSTLYCYRRVAT